MKIVNIVATVKLSSPLDLRELNKILKGSEYSTDRPWMKYRLMPEGYYIPLFKSGKFIITGVVDQKRILDIANRVVKELENHGLQVTVNEIIVHNIVVTDILIMPTSLENLIYSLDLDKVSYEPEQFPGLIYKDWGATFLLFPSGKFIMNGLTNENEIKIISEKFKHLIQKASIRIDML